MSNGMNSISEMPLDSLFSEMNEMLADLIADDLPEPFSMQSEYTSPNGHVHSAASSTPPDTANGSTSPIEHASASDLAFAKAFKLAKKPRSDDSDYESETVQNESSSDSDVNAAITSSSSPHHPDAPESMPGPMKKISKKRRRSKDSKFKVERNRGACDKHKRDRKRCPLDCPMRTIMPDLSPKKI